MRNRLAAVVLGAAIAGFGIPTIAGAADAHPAKAGDQQAVPVKQVVLYTSGVGYFEHFGTVKGDGFTELHFKTKQINDILKSLLLEDLDHGKVSTVTYGSQEPLSHTLKSFQVDLSTAPPLSGLLSQLRGASVTVSLPKSQLTGQVLSVEKKQKAADKQVIDVWVLNLLLPGGSIRPVELDQVGEIRLDDPKLQQELVKALAAVAASRDQESKPVAIHFTGQGERRVRIGYLVEAPVWKASYRLVLTEDAKNEQPPVEKPKAPAGGDKPAAAEKPADAKDGGKLQGWAIVENQTDGDWENVQLSLVSGRPISFIEDLYQPLYVARPVVEPELYASLRPQRYKSGLAQQNQQMANKDADGDVLLSDGAPDAQFGSGGGGAHRKRNMQEIREKLERGESKDAARRQWLTTLDPTASVSALASGASVGEFFQYTVGDVSLPRQKSAMIPIITDLVKTTRLSIFNAGVLPDHPLLGARLINSTGKLLPQGPITVLDGNAYAGDASIQDLPSNQSRLLSYGIDQNLLVHNNDQTEVSSLTTARISKGVLELTYKQIFHQVYVAENKGKADRTLLIEHPKRQGWHLIDSNHPLETTDDLYRFEEIVPAGKTKTLAVQEEVIGQQEFAILPMDVGQLDAYIRTAQIPEPVKKSLREAGKLRQTVADTERQIQAQLEAISEITAEQGRIRENMKAVSQSSDYYQRLLKELDGQETHLGTLKDDVKKLRTSMETQRKALEDFLEKLDVG